jgi:hypothetical protein
MRDHQVTRPTASRLQRARRELAASLALTRLDSPARVPILAYMTAIDAERASPTNYQNSWHLIAGRGTARGVTVAAVPRCQSAGRREMPDTRLIVPGMHEPPHQFDITVTLARDGGCVPGPAEFAATAQQAASHKNASAMTAHTAEKIISTVTVQTAGRSCA